MDAGTHRFETAMVGNPRHRNLAAGRTFMNDGNRLIVVYPFIEATSDVA
jgi:hypothetical protein